MTKRPEELETIPDPYRRCCNCHYSIKVVDETNEKAKDANVLCSFYRYLRKYSSYPCRMHAFARSPEVFFL